MGACGIATWADFLPSHGGSLVSAFPTSDTTDALGWLPDSTALVAAPTGCEDSVPGIYRVWPSAEPQNPDPPELVLAAHAQDATLWGFGH
jgi:hypothetical protein